MCGCHPDWEQIVLPGADLQKSTRWLAPEEASALFETLQHDVPWGVHRIRLFGREFDAPRLSCWMGDSNALYTYSKTRFMPVPWLGVLDDLRRRLECACDTRFNSVLANLYRSGQDAMGWHSDDEPELGVQPVIASLSLGATRRFRLRPRQREKGRRAVPPAGLDLMLSSGSLLRMAGDIQHLYQHALPRTRQAVGARINLTFRWIHPRS